MKSTPLWTNMDAMTKGKIKNKSIKNFKLIDQNKELQSVLDTSAGHINILVFWASWCGPCLAEIPDLKKLYSGNMANKRINMVSISSDKDKNKWLEKLKQENMPWKQLIISGEEEKNEVFYAFKLNSTIPVTVVADNKGNIISKFYGYDPNENIKIKLEKVLKSVGSNL
jgi:thiol-disulfide isomerase/thioredoxin